MGGKKEGMWQEEKKRRKLKKQLKRGQEKTIRDREKEKEKERRREQEK